MAAFEGGTPRREDLDRIVPDRPVFLTNRDGHGAWVNSKALELAGVTADTPDPADGRIERDEDGTPTGTLHEGAMDLVTRLLPDDTPAELEEALRRGQRHLHGFGITAWQDAIVEPHTEERAYVALANRGELTARVIGAMWWDHHRGADQIEEFVERRRATSIGRYQATSIKLMMDGVLENFTGAMLEPYLDRHGGNRQPWPPADRPGWPRDMGPEARCARLPTAFPRHRRSRGREPPSTPWRPRDVPTVRRIPGPHIAHIQVIHPDDIPRFRELDVVANAQPLLGRPRRPDGRPHDPFHRRPLDVAIPVPFAAGGRRGDRDGFGLERVEP